MECQVEKLFNSLKSIVWHPSFINYRPDKKEELTKNLGTIYWAFSQDDMPLTISCHAKDSEWAVENVLFPIRFRYGCFYDFEASNYSHMVTYKTTINGIRVDIDLHSIENCKWVETEDVSYKKYKMVCE